MSSRPCLTVLQIVLKCWVHLFDQPILALTGQRRRKIRRNSILRSIINSDLQQSMDILSITDHAKEMQGNETAFIYTQARSTLTQRKDPRAQETICQRNLCILICLQGIALMYWGGFHTSMSTIQAVSCHPVANPCRFTLPVQCKQALL